MSAEDQKGAGEAVAAFRSSVDEAVQIDNRRESTAGIARCSDFSDRIIVPNVPFLILLAVYAAAMVVTVGQMPERQTSSCGVIVLTVVTQFLPMLLFALVVSCAYQVARRGSGGRPIRAIAVELWALLSDRRRLMLGLPILAIMTVFKYVYMEFKVNIPLLQPFSWDRYFAELGRLVHGGIDPWLWVDPVFSLHPALVSALNVNYALWFFFMWVVFGYFAFAKTASVHRTRFFLAFFLTWILGGTMLAVAFSSAGPAFYGDLGLAPNPYTPLMDKFAAINATSHLPALNLQRLLWIGYANEGNNFGISAMPSMHNAIAMLIVLATWKVNRVASLVLLTHAFLVYIGSFYLAWHYAIDAYLGWLVAAMMWWLVKPLAERWHRRLQ